MKVSRLVCAALGLVLGLAFYLAHRSDHTVSNRLLTALCGQQAFLNLKHDLRNWSPVPVGLRGCLPSALWCFIVTSLCGGWRVPLGAGRMLPLALLCPAVNGLWEGVQWMGWTDGHADLLDVVAGYAGFGLAELVLSSGERPVDIAWRWDWRVGVMVTCFACMGFADVWR